MHLCDECDERVHSANAIASRHERVRISTDAREDWLSGESAPRVHATTSRRVGGGGHDRARAAATMGSVRGGDNDGVTDDVFGLYDEYISEMPATTFPIETLGGGFWGDGDALQVDAVLDTDKFLRDSPMGRSPSPGVANARARGGTSSPSAESKPATLSQSEIEALQKLGSKKRGGQGRLGPILDDSAIKFIEENPGYGNYESSSNETTFVAGQLDALAGKMGTSSVKTEPSPVTNIKVEPSDTANVPPPTEVQIPPGGFNIPMNLAQMQAGGATFPGADTYSGLPQPQTRLERLKRWKEKRKNRNFNKVIRYQSRKACADSRPRIKGKFVKVMSVPDLSKIRDVSEDADSDVELDKIDEEEARDTVGELGLDKGLRAPPSMSRLKKGLASSASMPDFSMYNSFD